MASISKIRPSKKKGHKKPEMSPEAAANILTEAIEQAHKQSMEIKENAARQNRVCKDLFIEGDRIRSTLLENLKPTINVAYSPKGNMGAVHFQLNLCFWDPEKITDFGEIADPKYVDMQKKYVGRNQAEIFREETGLDPSLPENKEAFDSYNVSKREEALDFYAKRRVVEAALDCITNMIAVRAAFKSEEFNTLSVETSLFDPSEFMDEDPEDAEAVDEWKDKFLARIDQFCKERTEKLQKMFDELTSIEDIKYLIEHYIF